MKTYTLKFKAALIAALLALSAPAGMNAEIPKRAVVAILQDAEFNTWLAKQISEDATLIPSLSDVQFLELMVNRIKHDAVEQIIDDVEGWIKGEEKPNLIRLYQRQLLIIKNLMLDPMMQRLTTAAANSDFAQIIQNAHKVANTMAYSKLEELTKTLAAHKITADWNKGKPHILGGKLKKLLPKIIAPDTLTKLEKELTEILELVKRSCNSEIVTKELTDLQTLIAEVKAKAASSQNAINGIELLTKISKMERFL